MKLAPVNSTLDVSDAAECEMDAECRPLPAAAEALIVDEEYGMKLTDVYANKNEQKTLSRTTWSLRYRYRPTPRLFIATVEKITQ